MRIGFVSYWFNRGQAVVTRYIKSIFDQAGHETFVLVRRGKLATTEGDWKDKNITIGSPEYDMDISVYTDWAKANKLDVCIFAQNYQFDAMRAIREMGIRTAGWFVWEQFSQKDVFPAKASLDAIFSLTKSDHIRYKKMGIDSTPIRWGIHPSLLNHSPLTRTEEHLWFYYPAGYCNERKSILSTIKAFNLVHNDNIRLLVTTQRPIDTLGDPRIQCIIGNVENHVDFHHYMKQCHVCLIPSKWEGLGLSFMEAIAFKMPIITTNFPPMNEYVIDGKTGLIVKCNTSKKLPNGLNIAEVDVADLSKKIAKMANNRYQAMSVETEKLIEHYSWKRTTKDFMSLLSKIT